MGVKIGDIFYTRWGYDQTDVDYYQVTAISATGKTCTLSAICAVEVPGTAGAMCCQLRPIPNSFHTEGWNSTPLKNKRIQHIGDRGTPYIRIDSSAMARPYQAGTTQYCSWYA